MRDWTNRELFLAALCAFNAITGCVVNAKQQMQIADLGGQVVTLRLLVTEPKLGD